MSETKRGRARPFGRRLKAFLNEGLQWWQDSHDHRGRLAGFEPRIPQLQEAVTRDWRPRRWVDADNPRRRDQFGRHPAQGHLLRLLEDPRLEPTNNRSEGGFRLAVIQRKVWQCSKRDGGAKAFATFARVIKTAMRQGRDVVEWLSALVRGVAPQRAPT